jgi:DNA polymerase III epsilon subunit-like protein
MKLFFDTETTGLPIWGLSESDSRQPRMVQLGMLVTDNDGAPLFSFGGIVRPEGYTIPAEVSEIHGITQDLASDYGSPVKLLLHFFSFYADKCDEIIAHNIKFDRLVMSAELARDGKVFPVKSQFCTMLASTGICKIKKANGYKWPKLSEAYQFFFGEELKDAHDALVDVNACKRIYFEGLKPTIRGGEPANSLKGSFIPSPTINPISTAISSVL